MNAKKFKKGETLIFLPFLRYILSKYAYLGNIYRVYKKRRVKNMKFLPFLIFLVCIFVLDGNLLKSPPQI